ncbi:MAG: MotA/TolQ/ExbB proton channel family protein [Planctomycetota bacterium]
MRNFRVPVLMAAIWAVLVLVAFARQNVSTPADRPAAATENVQPGGSGQASILSVREFFAAGGAIGYVIVFFSILMTAIIIDAAIGLRSNLFMPPGLAEEVHRCLAEHKVQELRTVCRAHPSFLSTVLLAGVEELASAQWAPVEKAMEDTAAEQTARISRRVEYLSVISTLAPMLGLMGTVWGMILAFMEFEQKANPQISELAPGIYKALVTTLQGLAVAIPSIGALAFFRRRIDDLAMESTLLAGRIFADQRRALQKRRTEPTGRTQ